MIHQIPRPLASSLALCSSGSGPIELEWETKANKGPFLIAERGLVAKENEDGRGLKLKLKEIGK